MVSPALSACAFLSDIRVWDSGLKRGARHWLRNFDQDEQDHANALLESFLFFSDELVDRLFVAAFDALAVEVVEQGTNYGEMKALWEEFRDRVLVTHPTGEMPSVTDSGYAFDRRARQLLRIPEPHILKPEAVVGVLLTGPPKPVVFVDDFVGCQATPTVTS